MTQINNGSPDLVKQTLSGSYGVKGAIGSSILTAENYSMSKIFRVTTKGNDELIIIADGIEIRGDVILFILDAKGVAVIAQDEVVSILPLPSPEARFATK